MNDHDGKSKTASGVDTRHYPSPPSHQEPPSTASPTQAEIAARAHELWIEEGRPAGSAERNWMEAERQLKAGSQSANLLEKVYEHAGSVQD